MRKNLNLYFLFVKKAVFYLLKRSQKLSHTYILVVSKGLVLYSKYLLKIFKEEQEPFGTSSSSRTCGGVRDECKIYIKVKCGMKERKKMIIKLKKMLYIECKYWKDYNIGMLWEFFRGIFKNDHLWNRLWSS